ncbi:MAG: thermonuclease family protein [Nitrospirae bacterium]|nr:thermonuclease family protein [Nitrospirota bacterium]
MQKVRVTKVHDGDTISIRTSKAMPFKTEKIRLIGIDAPELRQEPWGRHAKRHLKKLISKSDWLVNIELDIQQRDKYGRLLAYVWDNRGMMINEGMIADGYAVLFTLPPNIKYTDRLIEAQNAAKSAMRGVWGKNGLKEAPVDWRKRRAGS